MPWCPECDRFLSPSSVRPDGTCPSCRRTVDPGRAHAPVAVGPADAADRTDSTGATGKPADPDEEEPLPIPWHLKVLAGATAVYLGYRALQGIEWLVGRF